MPDIHVKFLYPVSRFKERPVPTLKHLSRFEILKHISKDKIDKLDLPRRLKSYLKHDQIFIEYNQSIDSS